jgi:hypothetical protein
MYASPSLNDILNFDFGSQVPSVTIAKTTPKDQREVKRGLPVSEFMSLKATNVKMT